MNNRMSIPSDLRSGLYGNPASRRDAARAKILRIPVSEIVSSARASLNEPTRPVTPLVLDQKTSFSVALEALPPRVQQQPKIKSKIVENRTQSYSSVKEAAADRKDSRKELERTNSDHSYKEDSKSIDTISYTADVLDGFAVSSYETETATIQIPPPSSTSTTTMTMEIDLSSNLLNLIMEVVSELRMETSIEELEHQIGHLQRALEEGIKQLKTSPTTSQQEMMITSPHRLASIQSSIQDLLTHLTIYYRREEQQQSSPSSWYVSLYVLLLRYSWMVYDLEILSLPSLDDRNSVHVTLKNIESMLESLSAFCLQQSTLANPSTTIVNTSLEALPPPTQQQQQSSRPTTCSRPSTAAGHRGKQQQQQQQEALFIQQAIIEVLLFTQRHLRSFFTSSSSSQQQQQPSTASSSSTMTIYTFFSCQGSATAIVKAYLSIDEMNRRRYLLHETGFDSLVKVLLFYERYAERIISYIHTNNNNNNSNNNSNSSPRAGSAVALPNLKQVVISPLVHLLGAIRNFIPSATTPVDTNSNNSNNNKKDKKLFMELLEQSSENIPAKLCLILHAYSSNKQHINNNNNNNNKLEDYPEVMVNVVRILVRFSDFSWGRACICTPVKVKGIAALPADLQAAYSGGGGSDSSVGGESNSNSSGYIVYYKYIDCLVRIMKQESMKCKQTLLVQEKNDEAKEEQEGEDDDDEEDDEEEVDEGQVQRQGDSKVDYSNNKMIIAKQSSKVATASHKSTNNSNSSSSWVAWYTWPLISRIAYILGNLTTRNEQHRHVIGGKPPLASSLNSSHSYSSQLDDNSNNNNNSVVVLNVCASILVLLQVSVDTLGRTHVHVHEIIAQAAVYHQEQLQVKLLRRQQSAKSALVPSIFGFANKHAATSTSGNGSGNENPYVSLDEEDDGGSRSRPDSAASASRTAAADSLIDYYNSLDEQQQTPQQSSSSITASSHVELMDTVIKLIRLLSNLSISREIGMRLGCAQRILEILTDVLAIRWIENNNTASNDSSQQQTMYCYFYHYYNRSSSSSSGSNSNELTGILQRQEELLLNAIGCLTNLTYYTSAIIKEQQQQQQLQQQSRASLSSATPPHRLEPLLVTIALRVSEGLFHINQEIILETSRVLGNLCHSSLVISALIDHSIHKALLVQLLGNRSWEIISAIAGVLVNFTGNTQGRQALLAPTISSSSSNNDGNNNNVLVQLGGMLRKLNPLKDLSLATLFTQILFHLITSQEYDDCQHQSDVLLLPENLLDTLEESLEIVKDAYEESLVAADTRKSEQKEDNEEGAVAVRKRDVEYQEFVKVASQLLEQVIVIISGGTVVDEEDDAVHNGAR